MYYSTVEAGNAAYLSIVELLDRQIFDPAWNPLQWEQEIQNTSSVVKVIFLDEDRNIPAGFIVYSAAGDCIDLTKIGVMPEYRRKKIARRAIEDLFKMAKERGYNNLMAEVAVTNKAARNLYHSLGFHQVQIRKKYYHNLIDAIVLQKEV